MNNSYETIYELAKPKSICQSDEMAQKLNKTLVKSEVVISLLKRLFTGGVLLSLTTVIFYIGFAFANKVQAEDVPTVLQANAQTTEKDMQQTMLNALVNISNSMTAINDKMGKMLQGMQMGMEAMNRMDKKMGEMLQGMESMQDISILAKTMNETHAVQELATLANSMNQSLPKISRIGEVVESLWKNETVPMLTVTREALFELGKRESMENPAIAQTIKDVGNAVKEAAKDNHIDTDKLFLEDAVLLTYMAWEAAKGLGSLDDTLEEMPYISKFMEQMKDMMGNMMSMMGNMSNNITDMNRHMYNMNGNMATMTRDIDSTMGRMGRWMPW
jgi:methyl-accepting chemotaxis protein